MATTDSATQAATTPAATTKTDTPTPITMSCLTPSLGVKSVSDSIDYYTDKLGFTCTQTNPPLGSNKKPIWASLTFGENVKIMIATQESIAKEYSVTDTKKLGGGFTLYYAVSDVDEYFKMVKSKGGVNILKEPGDTKYGMCEFAIQDLDGYVLTFGSMIKGFDIEKYRGEMKGKNCVDENGEEKDGSEEKKK